MFEGPNRNKKETDTKISRRDFLRGMGATAAAAGLGFSSNAEAASAEKAELEAVQMSLQILGLYKGEVTGEYNDATQEAIKQFQTEHFGSEEATGVIDDKTLNRILECTMGDCGD